MADIGGTNARFAWLADGDTAPTRVAKLPAAQFDGPAAAAEAYLQQLGAGRPHAAAFAMAGATDGDRVTLLNSGWTFSRTATQQALGLDEFLLLNDFEALALALPCLAPTQLRRWPGAPAQADGALAVVGPGTGLGVAGLVRAGPHWLAVGGEGGHASIASTDAFEAALLAAAQREFTHVSAERLLSGIGLPVLYRAVAQVLGQPAQPLNDQQVLQLGLAGSDATCVRTLEAFCALLGSFAGNVALTLGARGGLYIGGGLVPRLGDLFFASRFRERFVAKGRLQGYLEAIPLALITDTLAALSGAAQALAQR